jgi:hypothetical protein
MKRLIAFTFSVFLLHSCTQEPKGTKLFFYLNTTGTYAVQMLDAYGNHNTFDTLVLHGSDVFTVHFDTVRTVSFIPLEGDLPVVHAVIGPETSKLSVEANGYITGDAENNWLAAQRKMQLDLIAFTDSLDQIKQTYADSSTFHGLYALDSSFYNYADAYRQRIIDSLVQRPNRISNLLTIYHRIGRSPVIDYMVDRKVLQNVLANLLETFPGSPDVISFQGWMKKYEESYQLTLQVQEAAEKFQPGHPFPEMSLETLEGQQVNIARGTLENHVVAVWASWCASCTNELSGMSRTQDMENWLCLSIDGLPEQRSPLGEWSDAVKNNRIGGTHLSDLMGGKSKIITGLGIQNLPVYFKVEKGIITQRVSSVKELNL